MAVSKGIALALDLSASVLLQGLLDFGLGPQLAQGAPGSSKRASLTLGLGNLSCCRGRLAIDIGPHLAPEDMVSEGARLTLDLCRAPSCRGPVVF